MTKSDDGSADINRACELNTRIAATIPRSASRSAISVSEFDKGGYTLSLAR